MNVSIGVHEKNPLKPFTFFDDIFTTMKRRNKVKVLGGVFDVGIEKSVIKMSQKNMGCCNCTVKYGHCELIYLRHMYNFNHNKARYRRKSVRYDKDKYSGYWGMKIIQFNNIFRVTQLGMIPGSVSNYYIVYQKTIKISTKTRTFPHVLMLENIEFLVLLEFSKLLLPTITNIYFP